MTRPDHPSGTDRVAEVAGQREFSDFELVVNIQGDEPFLPAAAVTGSVGLVREQRFLLATAAAGAMAREDVRMVEVEGEGAKYWPRWRGPSGQGLVPPGTYTDKWSPKTNLWSVTVPGSGNSSPIVWGDRIFLTTGYGSGERLSMLAYARADGRKLWETFITQNGVEYNHAKNGFASATPATDGELVYASFGRHGLVAFDFNGKIAWHHKFGIIDNYHGPAGSPVLYKDRIFIYQDANPAPGQTAGDPSFRPLARPTQLPPESSSSSC